MTSSSVSIERTRRTRNETKTMDDAIERVERAIEAMRQGEFVIILDAQDRENEGDLCVAAGGVTPEDVNFMAKHGRGLICLALSCDRLD